MFHFPGYGFLVVRHKDSVGLPQRVSPFGNPRIEARLAAPRGLSQPCHVLLHLLMSRHPPYTLNHSSFRFWFVLVIAYYYSIVKVRTMLRRTRTLHQLAKGSRRRRMRPSFDFSLKLQCLVYLDLPGVSTCISNDRIRLNFTVLSPGYPYEKLSKYPSLYFDIERYGFRMTSSKPGREARHCLFKVRMSFFIHAL